MSYSKKAKELAKVLFKIDSERQMLDFLQGILTPKELEEIPTRLQVVKMLKAGESQHKIAEKLKIGVATVTRGSKEIQAGRFSNL